MSQFVLSDVRIDVRRMVPVLAGRSRSEGPDGRRNGASEQSIAHADLQANMSLDALLSLLYVKGGATRGISKR